ncbi:MAG: GntR family transcriptional regulator [Bacillota bacterium]|nr:GntR family transcriptional regulator [Bacillota bacterium]
MKVVIDRKSGIPIYLQLKKHIEYLISTGFWERGKQLPTERALAEELEISRNTVSVAYRELEADGLLVSYQGKGTFVAGQDDAKRRRSREDRLLRIIDSSLSDALEIGFSLDEFASMVVRRAGEKKEFLSHLELTFVECNREQVDYFAKELELGSGVHINPLAIEDFADVRPADFELLRHTDMIVTTFFHLDQLKALVPERAHEVIGIALDADITTMIRVARLPREPIGLVCNSELFAQSVQDSLSMAGLDFPEFLVCTSHRKEDVAGLLGQVRAVLVSPGRNREVQRLLPEPMEVIEFVYRPDEGSVNMLRSALVDKKETRLTQ